MTEFEMDWDKIRLEGKKRDLESQLSLLRELNGEGSLYRDEIRRLESDLFVVNFQLEPPEYPNYRLLEAAQECVEAMVDIIEAEERSPGSGKKSRYLQKRVRDADRKLDKIYDEMRKAEWRRKFFRNL